MQTGRLHSSAHHQQIGLPPPVSSTARARARARATTLLVKAAGVRVHVSIQKQANFGDALKLVGSAPELGDWDPNRAPELQWNEGNVWKASVELPADSDVSFKFVLVNGEWVDWEQCSDRCFQVPQSPLSIETNWGDEQFSVQNDAGEAPAEQPSESVNNEAEQVSQSPAPAASNGAGPASDERLSHNQWQGKDIAYMRSNDHSRERQGKWHTAGLEGAALHIVSRDEKAANWLAKMESVKALLVDQAPDKKPGLDALAAAYVYLQWIGTGAIVCVEGGGHHRPNHHAELSRVIFRSLERVIGDPAAAGVQALLARRTHPKLPSFTEAYTASTPLTRIRDIAHRNDIPHELKQEIKHTIQNKLHRNAGPEDLVATEQMIERLEAEGNHPEAFLEEFRTFRSELRDFFNASSFTDMLDAVRPSFGDNDTQALDIFLKAKTALDANLEPSVNDIMDTLHTLTTVRALLNAGLASGPRNDAPDSALAMRQRWRLSELRAEEYAFVLLSQFNNLLESQGGSPAIAGGRDGQWALPLGAVLLGVRHMGLSGWQSGECMAIENELTAWQRLGEFGQRDSALRLKATLERAQRLTQQYTDSLLEVLPPMADRIGAALGLEHERIMVFTEAEVRASVVFQLSSLLSLLLKAARQSGVCDEWDAIVAGTATGELKEVGSMDEVALKPGEDVVLLVRKARGDEEVGALGKELRGVILAQSLPHLSHLGVRARQERVAFVTCEDGELLDAQVRPLLGRRVRLEATPQGVTLVEDDGSALAADSNGSAAVTKDAAHGSGKATKGATSKVSKPELIHLADADIATCGAKAAACAELERAAAESDASFATPKAAVVPFGAMDAAIKAATKEKEYQQLLKQVASASHGELDSACKELQELIAELRPADAVLADAGKVLGTGAKVYVRSSANVEDIEGMSGAGLYESLPNVEAGSPEQLGRAVAEVWASLYTRRAVLARRAAGVDQAGAAMAVLLMEMLAPQLSFVLHTASPLDRDSSVLHAELAPGLGETLASGTRGSGWRLEVSKETGNTAVSSFANFSTALVAPSGQQAQAAGQFSLVPRIMDYSKEALSLKEESRQQLGQRLCNIGEQLEKAFGGAQDVEGAVVGDTVYIVQSRPQP